MMSHPGKTVSIYEIARFVGTALTRAMTPNNIIHAFKKTGIFLITHMHSAMMIFSRI